MARVVLKRDACEVSAPPTVHLAREVAAGITIEVAGLRVVVDVGFDATTLRTALDVVETRRAT